MLTCFGALNVMLIGNGVFFTVVLVSMLLVHTAASTQFFMKNYQSLCYHFPYIIFSAERKYKKKRKKTCKNE